MIQNLIAQAVNFRPAQLPIGKAAAYSVGLGFSDAFQGFLNSMWPGLPKGAAAAVQAFVAKLDMIQRYVGSETSELFSVASLMSMLNGNDFLPVRAMVGDGVSKLFGFIDPKYIGTSQPVRALGGLPCFGAGEPANLALPPAAAVAANLALTPTESKFAAMR